MAKAAHPSAFKKLNQTLSNQMIAYFPSFDMWYENFYFLFSVEQARIEKISFV